MLYVDVLERLKTSVGEAAIVMPATDEANGPLHALDITQYSTTETNNLGFYGVATQAEVSRSRDLDPRVAKYMWANLYCEVAFVNVCVGEVEEKFVSEQQSSPPIIRLFKGVPNTRRS